MSCKCCVNIKQREEVKRMSIFIWFIFWISLERARSGLRLMLLAQQRGSSGCTRSAWHAMQRTEMHEIQRIFCRRSSMCMWQYISCGILQFLSIIYTYKTNTHTQDIQQYCRIWAAKLMWYCGCIFLKFFFWSGGRMKELLNTIIGL